MDCSRSLERRQPRAARLASTAVLGLLGLALAAGCGGSGSPPSTDGGPPQAPVMFNPASHDFKNVTVGQTSQGMEFTITSTATATLNSVSAALVGTDVSQFRLASNHTCTMAITRGGSCKVSVQFAPTSAGAKTAAIEFRSGTAVKRAELTGMGIRGVALTVTPVSGDFGSVAQGTESEQKTFIVKNEGGVEAPRPTVVPAADFPVKENGCTGPLAAMATCNLKVAFAPTTVGSRMGTMVVSVPDSNPFMVPMQGVGTVRPSVMASPSSVDFGDVPVGRTANQAVTLRNPNNTAVTGLAITSQNPSYTVSANTCTGMMIPANGMCSVTVTFAPGAPGEVKSELTIAVAGGTNTGVPLSGTGIRAAVLEMTTSSHDFGSVPVNARQGGLTITLANVGQETASAVAVALSGPDASEFEIEPNCPTSLTAGATCDIRVFFKPANEGAATATLNATGNPGGMDTATLMGTGVKQPTVTLVPTSGDFSTIQVGQNSAPVNFDVTNTGGVPTGALRFTIVGTEFRIVAGSSSACEAGLAAGQMCSLQVQFSPTSAGTKTSTLTVAGDAVGMVSATLMGIAIDPPRLVITPDTSNFGAVAVGLMSSEVSFVVSNAGGQDSGVVSVMTGSAQFQITSNACQNKALKPGDTCSVSVRFLPGTTGDFTTKLTASATPGIAGTADLMGVGTPAAGIAFQNGAGTSISVLDFGPTAVQVGLMTAPVTVFVRNIGQVGTGMLATVLAGMHPSDFAIADGTNNCGAGLAPGAVCSMQVLFKPTLGGAREATITVSSGTGGQTQLLLKGPGAEVFRWEVAGVPVTEFDFATLSAGRTTDVTFTLKPLAVTGTYTINLDGGAPPNFIHNGGTCNGTSLTPPLESCTVIVRFQPQLPLGPKMGTLSATNSAGRSAGVALTGTSGGPLQFTPAPHNFGSFASGTSSPLVDFTLRNNGASAVTGLTVTLAMSNSGDLSIAENGCAPTLNAGASCLVKVRFLAGAPGVKTATLTATGSFLAGGNVQTATATSALTGTVTSAASISITGSGEFGSVVVGATSDVRTFTVTNGTGAPVSGGVNVGAIAGPHFVLTRDGCVLADNVTRLPLAAGQSCTFDVRFSPQAAGPLTATASASASPGGAVSVVLNGTGLTRLLLEPAARNFDAGGNLNVAGATNARFEFTITNRGLAAVTLTTDVVESTVVGAGLDHDDYFGIFTNAGSPCPVGPLAAGASCKVDVAMITPGTPVLGAKFARLDVTDTGAGPGMGQVVSSELSGTLRGDAVLDFSDTSPRNFGNVKVGTASGIHFVQVRNSGGVRSGPFQITPITGGFRQMPAVGTNPATGNAICSPGIQLDPAQTCDFLLQFAPTVVGLSAVTLDIWVTGPGEKSASAPALPGLPGPRQLMLSGTGVAASDISLTPTPVDFDGAPSGGAVVTRMVTLNNDTGAALSIGSITVLGGAAGFAKTADTCGVTVTAGLTCTITVTFTAAGPPARQTDTLRVVATPMGSGAQTADAILVGQVLTPPTLLIEPPAEGADWGGALVGIPSPKRTFVIRNVGQGTTTAAAMVSVAGGQAGDFVVGDNTCTAVLAPNEACSVSITLTPAGVGARATTLTATAGAASDTQALSATGVVPSTVQLVSITGGGTSVNFGNRAVRSQTGIDVVIKNADTAQTITTPTFTLSDMVNFSVDTNPGGASDCFDEIADGGGLEGGEQCTIRVFFRPQSLPDASVAAPNMSSTLIVGGANTNLTLMVQGNAVSALSITPATHPYGGVIVNMSASQTFMITNSSDSGIPATGLIAVSLDGPNTGDFRISGNTCAAVTPGLTAGGPGSTCTVTVAFEPKSPGPKSATLAITASPTNGASATLTGTGN